MPLSLPTLPACHPRFFSCFPLCQIPPLHFHRLCIMPHLHTVGVLAVLAGMLSRPPFNSPHATAAETGPGLAGICNKAVAVIAAWRSEFVMVQPTQAACLRLGCCWGRCRGSAACLQPLSPAAAAAAAAANGSLCWPGQQRRRLQQLCARSPHLPHSPLRSVSIRACHCKLAPTKKCGHH